MIGRRGCLLAAFGGRVEDGAVVPGEANQAIAAYGRNVLAGRLVIAEAEVASLLEDSVDAHIAVADGDNRRRYLDRHEVEAVADWVPALSATSRGALVTLGTANIASEDYRGLSWVARQAAQIFDACAVESVVIIGQAHHLRDYGLDVVAHAGIPVDEAATAAAIEQLDVWDPESDQIWVREPLAWKVRVPAVKAALIAERVVDHFRSDD